jgi:hypothetical protein
MAQRKKRAAARRRKAATRSKAHVPPKPARGKTAKSAAAKAAPGKRVTKAKRAVTKKAVPIRARRPNQPSTTSIETVVVDVLTKDPVAGVVVTEVETTDMHGPNAVPEQPEESPGAAPPESEERAA